VQEKKSKNTSSTQKRKTMGDLEIFSGYFLAK